VAGPSSVETVVLDRLSAMRGPGESYSDIILRLVELEAAHR
jgi:predicted CopG family antitoxin